MVAGHFGFAALVKSRAQKTPLWALMLACQWLDVVFIPLFAAKIETIVGIDGPVDGGGYGRVIIHADYTHSLPGALGLSVLFAGVAAIFWGQKRGLILGGVVFSHWLLDLVMHRADLPIFWGHDGPKLGFGLWRSEPASIVAELILVVLGALFYYRAGKEKSGARARLPAALLLASGLLVLGLNVMGL